MRLATCSALSILLILSVAGVTPAAVEQVSIGVDGLACPFCAYNIEKRVKTLQGVERGARVEVIEAEGIARFPWKLDVAFDPFAVRQQIRKAGFTPAGMQIEATGTVRASEEQQKAPLQLELFDGKTNQAVLVLPGNQVDRRESFTALKAVSEARAQEQPLAVRVYGEVRINDDAWHINLQRWEPLEYGAKVVLDVDDLACEKCSTRVMQSLARLDGVIHAEADHQADQVSVWMQSKSPNPDALRAEIQSAGFKVTRVQTHPGNEEKK